MVVAEALTNKEQLKKIDLNGKQSHFQTIAEKKVRKFKKKRIKNKLDQTQADVRICMMFVSS